MNENDFEPFKPPALGRTIARAFATVGAAFKKDWNEVFAHRWQRLLKAIQRHYLKPFYFLAFILIPAWALLALQIGFILVEQLAADIPGDATEKRAHFYSLGLTITGLGAVLAAPFVLVKSWVNERQTRAAEEGLITDRITKAIEQLGTEKTVKIQVEKKVVKAARVFTELVVEERTEPNLEVRLGAIYALERIAQDSQRDHIPIMETLCAYIRENSNQRTPEEFGEEDWVGLDDYSNETACEKQTAKREARFGNYTFESKAWKWARSIKAPRADLQAALNVLGRRSEDRRRYELNKAYQLDLRAVNLQAADFSDLALGPILLSEARLEGASFRKAELKGAQLYAVNMKGADLVGVMLEGAFLREAEMEGARLYGAIAKGADMTMARLEGAELREAQMEGTNFRQAKMECADLYEAKLEQTNLGEANLNFANLAHCRLGGSMARAADFTQSQNMTQDQANKMFGDTATKLPASLLRTTELNHNHSPMLLILQFMDKEFERWKKAGNPEGEILNSEQA